MVFVVHWHEWAMSLHVFPILNPPPTSLPIPSLCVIPVHQPWTPCLMHKTWTDDLFHLWYYTCFSVFSQIIPPSPSPTESKRLFYVYVSLLLSWIWDYHYDVSKFHIYGLVYCMTGEGNGNPLQCSCLENPRGSGPWWTAVYGVAQGWTPLKRLSSSSILYEDLQDLLELTPKEDVLFIIGDK